MPGQDIDAIEADIDQRKISGFIFSNTGLFNAYTCLLLIECLRELRLIREAVEDD